MTKSTRQQIRYSISFKQKVVNEIEREGLSISEVSLRYNIKGAETVKNWLRSLGKSHLVNKVIRVEMMGEADRLREMEKEILKLKAALGDAYMQRDCAEEVVKQASKIVGEDLKKKFGVQASPGLGSDTR
jgi:transposase-like protein